MIPERQRSQPSKENEWWVPLAEKAYAQFNGSYANIDGGHTAWALYELTGGVAAMMDLNMNKINAIGRQNFISFIKKYLKKRGIFCTSTMSNQSGLFGGHAYSLLSIEDVEVNGAVETLARIRNPHGCNEWTGPWSDNSSEWSEVSAATKESVGYSDNEDGGFFMSFNDWVDQFDSFTFCYLTPDNCDKERRAIGTLIPGVNCGNNYNDLQFALTVPNDQDVWLQTLLETYTPIKPNDTTG